jgi:hypothetical protein
MKPTFHFCNTEDSIMDYYSARDGREYGVYWLLEVEVVTEIATGVENA